MYSYTKEKKFPKRRLIVSLSCLLIAAAAFLTYEYSMKNPAKDTSVFKEDTTPVSYTHLDVYKRQYDNRLRQCS